MTNNDVIAELTRLLPSDPQYPWTLTGLRFGLREFSCRLENGRTLIVQQDLSGVVIGLGSTVYWKGDDIASAVADFLGKRTVTSKDNSNEPTP